ncbi:MAG: iron-siderophore ABC transporter substrate-binding protein [Cyanobacteria bacterium P01_F01_bin.153]
MLDNILALGAQPSGYAELIDLNIQTYDNPAEQIPYLGKWVTTKPITLGTRSSPSLERLTQLKPDIILGEHWFNKDEYSLLNQIAPTVLLDDMADPDKPQSWQQNIEGVAQALGRQAQAKELLATYDQKIAQARKTLDPVLQAHPRVLLLDSDFSSYLRLRTGNNTTVGRLLKDIGFEIVQVADAQGELQDISWETLPQVKADIVILMYVYDSVDDFFERPDLSQKQWTERPILESMPAVQQGRLLFVDRYLWSGVTRGPLSDQLILEALPDLLLPTVSETLEAQPSA